MSGKGEAERGKRRILRLGLTACRYPVSGKFDEMATHQEIGGLSDEDLLQRMVARYPNRFDSAYWNFFAEHVGKRLRPAPVVVDIGCGPGLFLRDISRRYPSSALYGYDVTPGMIEHARKLDYAGIRPTLEVRDVTTAPLPLAADTVHLVTMTAVLHVLDDPFPLLAEVRRVLAPGGIFLIDDWVRGPMRDYLASRSGGTGDDLKKQRARWLRLFPVHNKYTVEDWEWLLSESGFSLEASVAFRPQSRIFVLSLERGNLGTQSEITRSESQNFP